MWLYLHCTLWGPDISQPQEFINGCTISLTQHKVILLCVFQDMTIVPIWLTFRLQGCETFSLYVALTFNFYCREHNWVCLCATIWHCGHCCDTLSHAGDLAPAERTKSMQRTSLSMLILQQGRLCPCAIIIGEIMVEKKYVIGILHYMYVPDLQLHIVMCWPWWCLGLLSPPVFLFLSLIRQGLELFGFSHVDHAVYRSYWWIVCLKINSRLIDVFTAHSFWHHFCPSSAIVSVFSMPESHFLQLISL